MAAARRIVSGVGLPNSARPPKSSRRSGVTRKAADRHETALQRRRRTVRVSVGRDQHVPRLHNAARRLDQPAARSLLHSIDGDAGDDRRTAARRGRGKPVHILRGVQPAAPLVDQDPVIGVGAHLRPLLRARHEMDAVVEDAGKQRLLRSKRLEMRRLPCGLDVACPRVLAVDALLDNQHVEPGNRLGGRLEELSRAPLTEPRDERGGPELEAGQHLTAVA